MDNLARDMMLAKQAGMSYGKWKALHPNTKPKVKPVIPDGWRACEYCGKIFKGIQGKRFCEDWCRREAYKEKEKAIKRECKKKWLELKKGSDSIAEQKRSTDIS